MRNRIIYSLNIEDIQIIAQQELGRDLLKEEVESLIEPIADRINWVEAIEAAINEMIS